MANARSVLPMTLPCHGTRERLLRRGECYPRHCRAMVHEKSVLPMTLGRHGTRKTFTSARSVLPKTQLCSGTREQRATHGSIVPWYTKTPTLSRACYPQHSRAAVHEKSVLPMTLLCHGTRKYIHRLLRGGACWP